MAKKPSVKKAADKEIYEPRKVGPSGHNDIITSKHNGTIMPKHNDIPLTNENKKLTRISFVIDKEMNLDLDRLVLASKESDRYKSKAAIIREAVGDYLTRHGKKN